MDVNRRGNVTPKRSHIKKRPSRFWKSALCEIDMNFVRKNEESTPRHAFGYETAQLTDKPFLNRSGCTRFSRAPEA